MHKLAFACFYKLNTFRCKEIDKLRHIKFVICIKKIKSRETWLEIEETLDGV